MLYLRLRQIVRIRPARRDETQLVAAGREKGSPEPSALLALSQTKNIIFDKLHISTFHEYLQHFPPYKPPEILARFWNAAGIYGGSCSHGGGFSPPALRILHSDFALWQVNMGN